MKKSSYIFLTISSLVAFTVKLHAMNDEKSPLLQTTHYNSDNGVTYYGAINGDGATYYDDAPTYARTQDSQSSKTSLDTTSVSIKPNQIEKIIKNSSISPASQEIKNFSAAYANPQQKWPIYAAIKKSLDSRELLIPIKVKTIEDDNMVFSVALSSSGKFVALGFELPKLKIVNLETDECIQLTADSVSSMPIMISALSPNGRSVAFSCALSKKAFIWDCWEKKEIAALSGHKALITSIAIPNAKTVFTLCMDNTIRKWNLQTGACLETCQCSDVVNSSLSITGKYYATINHNDQSVDIFDRNTNTQLNIPIASTGKIRSVALSQRADRIIIGQDAVAKIYDVQTKECLYVINAHKDNIFSVAISSDGRFVATGSLDKTATIWDLAWYQDLSFEQLILAIKIINNKGNKAASKFSEWKNIFQELPIYIQNFLKTI